MNEPTEKVIVVKIGGSTLGEHDTTVADIVQLQQKGFRVVVIHGGGKIITDWLNKHGIESRFSQGKRVTDRPTLEVATAVLAGMVNKEITGAINRAGGRAIGLSGVDGKLLRCSREDEELGYVGTVNHVHEPFLTVLLDAGYIPVIAPIGYNDYAGADDDVLMLNINADTAAGAVAASLAAWKMIFLTDVDGIRGSDGNVIAELTASSAQKLIDTGVAYGGMIPKIQSCLKALEQTPVVRIIDGRSSHALLDEAEGRAGGTTISTQ